MQNYPDVTDAVYRAHYLKQDRALSRKVIRAYCWTSLLLVYFDYLLLASAQWFLVLIILRLGFIIFSLRTLKNITLFSAAEQLEKRMLQWCSVMLLIELIGHFSVSATDSTLQFVPYVFDVWICAIFFIVIPLPLRVLRLLMLVFCSNVCALLALKNLPLAVNLALLIILPVSAVTGHTIAAYMYRYRRKILSAETELERIANTDSLTGVANRKEFLRISELEISRHQRLGKELSMLVLDLNHFNQISGSSAAQAVDIVLVEVSKRVKRVMRNYDCLARYGLEEFCVLLPEAGTDAAQSIAVRAKNTISAIPVAISGQELKVSASAGVATLMAGDTIETLYQRAIQALQHEKNSSAQY